MTSSPTGLFSKGTSVSDQLFVFGNLSSTPSNPSLGGNIATSSKDKLRLDNQTMPKGGGNNSPLSSNCSQ